LDVNSASEYTLPDLVQTLNRGFEGYLVPIHLSLTQFLDKLRKDNIDLTASRVLLADDKPSGIALIARRGWTSRLAAMGNATEIRGSGAGSWFMEKLIDDACQRGDREMVLEVIEQNERALGLYRKYGFVEVRRLIGLIRREAAELDDQPLQEFDAREMGVLISKYGFPDLPWQLSAETIAQMNPPVRGYCNDHAHVLISDPEETHVVIWSLLVTPESRGHKRGAEIVKAVIAHHPGLTWHVPAIYPEEMGRAFEQAGFEREALSQWQMSLRIDGAKSRQPE
jgi:ribosomal protein S18 acetylase RimI-like enzyme